MTTKQFYSESKLKLLKQFLLDNCGNAHAISAKERYSRSGLNRYIHFFAPILVRGSTEILTDISEELAYLSGYRTNKNGEVHINGYGFDACHAVVSSALKTLQVGNFSSAKIAQYVNVLQHGRRINESA